MIYLKGALKNIIRVNSTRQFTIKLFTLFFLAVVVASCNDRKSEEAVESPVDGFREFKLGQSYNGEDTTPYDEMGKWKKYVRGYEGEVGGKNIRQIGLSYCSGNLCQITVQFYPLTREARLNEDKMASGGYKKLDRSSERDALQHFAEDLTSLFGPFDKQTEDGKADQIEYNWQFNTNVVTLVGYWNGIVGYQAVLAIETNDHDSFLEKQEKKELSKDF